MKCTSVSSQMTNRRWKARGQDTWTTSVLVGTKHISGMVEAIVVKFCIKVGYVKSQCADDKSPLKGAWSGLHDSF